VTAYLVLLSYGTFRPDSETVDFGTLKYSEILTLLETRPKVPYWLKAIGRCNESRRAAGLWFLDRFLYHPFHPNPTQTAYVITHFVGEEHNACERIAYLIIVFMERSAIGGAVPSVRLQPIGCVTAGSSK
jgi:hypothetical protein